MPHEHDRDNRGMTDESRSRGRPPALDRDSVARVALRLFAESGYDAVSMSDIAAAAGVSRRTLFRHFASKADLIWDGRGPAEAARHEALERAAAVTAFEALHAASLAAVDALPDLDATRARLRVIASHPDLVAFGSRVLSTGTLTLVEHLLGRGLSPLSARVLAGSVTVAEFDAYLFWATETTDASPRATLERAFALLAHLADF